MEFVWIPPGNFTMGSDTGAADERPPHSVTIGKGFYMAKFEVTWSQLRTVTGSKTNSPYDCDGCPVDNFSWDEAQQFINSLNVPDHDYVYRLPTEAEWEYAARAGIVGDSKGDLASVAWYGNNSGQEAVDAEAILREGLEIYHQRLTANGNRGHTVGTRNKNGFGLFDMQGNVWEWVEDWYHENYNADPPTDGSAWLKGATERFRVLRGGSVWDLASSCRLTSRYTFPRDVHNVYFRVGIRVVAVQRPRP